MWNSGGFWQNSKIAEKSQLATFFDGALQQFAILCQKFDYVPEEQDTDKGQVISMSNILASRLAEIFQEWPARALAKSSLNRI